MPAYPRLPNELMGPAMPCPLHIVCKRLHVNPLSVCTKQKALSKEPREIPAPVTAIYGE